MKARLNDVSCCDVMACLLVETSDERVMTSCCYNSGISESLSGHQRSAKDVILEILNPAFLDEKNRSDRLDWGGGVIDV